MTKTVVVTRHKALVAVLEKKGLITEGTPVLEHVTADEVRGKHVVGVLPLSLAAEAASVTEVTLKVPLECRGKELSEEELEQFFVGVATFVVRKNNVVEESEVVQWNDKQGSRGRRPFLFLRDGDGKLWSFEGRDLPEVCKCREVDFVKDGKWSNSTWDVKLSEGCKVVFNGREDFDTRRLGNWSSWADVAARWGVTEQEAREFLERVHPVTASFLSF